MKNTNKITMRLERQTKTDSFGNRIVNVYDEAFIIQITSNFDNEINEMLIDDLREKTQDLDIHFAGCPFREEDEEENINVYGDHVTVGKEDLERFKEIYKAFKKEMKKYACQIEKQNLEIAKLKAETTINEIEEMKDSSLGFIGEEKKIVNDIYCLYENQLNEIKEHNYIKYYLNHEYKKTIEHIREDIELLEEYATELSGAIKKAKDHKNFNQDKFYIDFWECDKLDCYSGTYEECEIFVIKLKEDQAIYKENNIEILNYEPQPYNLIRELKYLEEMKPSEGIEQIKYLLNNNTITNNDYEFWYELFLNTPETYTIKEYEEKKQLEFINVGEIDKEELPF